jgi:hypothetical protein
MTSPFDPTLLPANSPGQNPTAPPPWLALRFSAWQSVDDSQPSVITSIREIALGKRAETLSSVQGSCAIRRSYFPARFARNDRGTERINAAGRNWPSLLLPERCGKPRPAAKRLL